MEDRYWIEQQKKSIVSQLEEIAIEQLSGPIYEYYSHGSGDQNTLRWNSQQWKQWKIRPRVLKDKNCDHQSASPLKYPQVNTSTTLLGTTITSPICIAPVAQQCMTHPRGELATAQASHEFNSIMAVSTVSTTALETITSTYPNGHFWFQLYVYSNERTNRRFLERAQLAGCKAIVITVDTPYVGVRENDIRNRFQLPSHLELLNFEDMELRKMKVRPKGIEQSASSTSPIIQRSASFTWEHIEWVKQNTQLPIVLKGILSPEDAIKAVEHNVQAIWVSNHGGRQLDTTPSAIDCLPSIVKSVRAYEDIYKKDNRKMEIYVDGGVRSGMDIFRGLALGANAVFLGRPILWGLASAGHEGVKSLLQQLHQELVATMLTTGCTSIQEITPKCLMNSFGSRAFL